MMRNLLEYRKSQESIGMSFNMIFSIILIIFFLVAAFVAIKYFLDYQRKIALLMFVKDLNDQITSVWQSAGIVANTVSFEHSVPSGITYACFININNDDGYSLADEKNRTICKAIKGNNLPAAANFVLYVSPTKKVQTGAYGSIEHISYESSFLNDCYCIPIQRNGKVKMTISTSTEDVIVKVA